MKQTGSPTAVTAWMRDNVKDQILRARLTNLIELVREYEQANKPRKQKAESLKIVYRHGENIPF